MTDDQKMAALLTECLADLDSDDRDSAEGRARRRKLLEGMEAIEPGCIEAMAARLQLRRLGIPTVH